MDAHGNFLRTAPEWAEPQEAAAGVCPIMQTFENRISEKHLWLAVAAPPMLYGMVLLFVQFFAGEGPLSPQTLFLLVGLAHAIPLAALAWVLCSTAACSVEPGCLVLHSVVRDRVFSLDDLTRRPEQEGNEVALDLQGSTLVLRPVQPGVLKAALEEAIPPKRRYLVRAGT